MDMAMEVIAMWGVVLEEMSLLEMEEMDLLKVTNLKTIMKMRRKSMRRGILKCLLLQQEKSLPQKMTGSDRATVETTSFRRGIKKRCVERLPSQLLLPSMQYKKPFQKLLL